MDVLFFMKELFIYLLHHVLHKLKSEWLVISYSLSKTRIISSLLKLQLCLYCVTGIDKCFLQHIYVIKYSTDYEFHACILAYYI
jgi:hypothetical protein